MKWLSLISLLWLLGLIIFFWGYTSLRYKLFPHEHVQAIFDYVDGEEFHSTLKQKLENDINLRPSRYIFDHTLPQRNHLNPLAVPNLSPRRNQPSIFINDKKPAYRLIVGAFDFKNTFWGAVLINEKGKVVHQWHFKFRPKARAGSNGRYAYVYGIGVLPDGSLIYNGSRPHTLTKIDACSNILWAKAGNFHHSASLTDDKKALWSFKGNPRQYNPALVKLDTQTGAVLKTIKIEAIEKQNPELFIFDLSGWPMNKERLSDFPHHNAIMALPAEYADAFPTFSAGDLLINQRTTNSLYVLDPDNLEVKFWYHGAGDGAHDADWQADGTITLFDNQMRAGWNTQIKPFSHIVQIDPKTHTHKRILDGESYQLFTRYAGRHQVTRNNSFVITSTRQGRAIEIDRLSGNVIFEFINDYQRDEGTVLFLSEAFYFPKEFFNFDIERVDCRSHTH